MERPRGDYAEGGYGIEGGDMQDGSTQDGSSAAEAINGPIVFSCAKCRTILGDTFAFAAVAPERNLFALQAVPETVVCGKTRKASETRGDEGSVFYELRCAECDAAVGRRYVTAAQGMDALRNTYALDMGCVVTYELGRCMDGRPPADAPPPPEFYASAALYNELAMVKSNVTAIAARLQTLEKSVASPRSAAGARKRHSQGLNPDIYHVDSPKRLGR
ncbi:hypothetical protein H4R18_000771 [Coemansia javaensis]|uniref:Mis18 domain-containing protein n=1 Tax=Coemansia javaensis TaxID=2761396 RepID=A0A9W8HMP1_9FUNG|nr:hypothetical protein H4R18_000771 [Coemansia javaensis]